MKVAPTETVLCQSVISVQKTQSVQRVLDCVLLVPNDLLRTETERNAVNRLSQSSVVITTNRLVEIRLVEI